MHVIRFLRANVFHEPNKDTHFSHTVHLYIPKQVPFEAAALHPCSWLYLEFGAKDGRYTNRFFSDGNSFLEEFLRATQSAMRGFCAIAFEGNPNMKKTLQDVRSVQGKKAHSFHVYAGIVPGRVNATEDIILQAPDDPHGKEAVRIQSIGLADAVRRLTFPMAESGRDLTTMPTAKGNNNVGTVVVRLNALESKEFFWYLELLEAWKLNGVMCERIDRLILNLQKMNLDPKSMSEQLRDKDVVRDLDALLTPPVSEMYDPKNGVSGLLTIAKDVNQRKGCRTTIHLLDEAGKLLSPSMLSDREVFYAILAGQPTFDERVGAQTESWMTVVPQDRLTIFTNKPRNSDEMLAARGRDTAVVQPHDPSLELRLPLMQSWSHLVRVRESWDRAMKNNEEIKWLALVDDDTFVFPGGMREYLSNFDHRVKFWGGSGEQARIDNGDASTFANWLREVHKKNGGKHCYLPTEDIPRDKRGSHTEYGISEVLNGRRVARKVSYMCGDTFCKRGCPAVPQGAAIVLSRALVEALRPNIEQCERDTAKLCKNCGSQRLYMCVNRYIGHARTLLTRGICRAPWKLEHRERFPFILTFHGFQRYHGMALSTGSLRGDMVELWQVGKMYEESVRKGHKSSYLVPTQKIADLIGCRSQGTYQKGECITKEGIKLNATDGKQHTPLKKDGHRLSDRKGSA